MFGLSSLSGVRRYLGELYELMALARIGRGKLSLCFKRIGNLFVKGLAINCDISSGPARVPRIMEDFWKGIWKGIWKGSWKEAGRKLEG